MVSVGLEIVAMFDQQWLLLGHYDYGDNKLMKQP